MPVTTLHRPAHRDALTHLEDAFRRGDLISVFGRCTVEYDGRAASSLGPGDRHVTLKPDGAALVHTDEGQQPVNWQPPGSTHSVAVSDGALLVNAERSTPDETLDVTFETVAHAAAFDVTDPEELAVTGTEADLIERILDDPDLVEPGFTPLATEHYLLICREEQLIQNNMRQLLDLMRSPDFINEINKLPGYAPDHCGDICTLGELLPDANSG